MTRMNPRLDTLHILMAVVMVATVIISLSALDGADDAHRHTTAQLNSQLDQQRMRLTDVIARQAMVIRHLDPAFDPGVVRDPDLFAVWFRERGDHAERQHVSGDAARP